MNLPPGADEWWVFDPDMDQDQYVRETLDAYLATPTTLGRLRPEDRELASQLFKQQVPFYAVDGAFVLAAARRTYLRDPQRPPLPPIRSLRYFLPIIREILETPIDPFEISFLWYRMIGKI